ANCWNADWPGTSINCLHSDLYAIPVLQPLLAAGQGLYRISSIIFSRKTSAGVFHVSHLRGLLLSVAQISFMS
ncbi:MAG: hypothetical protein P8P40_07175, partial [Sulfitobacter sp.]|nr:hypothetical protein [Sulfitobacter sp.]